MTFEEQPVHIESKRLCPACQAEVKPGTAFCGKCGQRLQGGVPADGTAGSNSPNAGHVDGDVSYWSRLAPAVNLWVLMLLVVGGFGIVARFLEGVTPSAELLVDLLMAVLVAVACWPSRKRLRPLFSKFGFQGVDLLVPVAAFLVLATFMWTYFEILGWLGIQSLGLLDNFLKAGWPWWTALLSLSVLPAIYEEVAFRGFIQDRLEQVSRPQEALVIQAVMFSTLHLLPTMFVSHFVFGVILGYLRQRSQSLYAGMLIHAAWNALVVWQEFQQLWLID